MANRPQNLGPGRGRGFSGARGGPLRSQPVIGEPHRSAWSNMPPRQRLWLNLAATLLFGVYLWIKLGWLVAVAVLFGIVVHELGHVLAMNALGCGPARMHIVPFFGGVAIGARAANSEYKGVLISLAGPVFGLLAAAPFVVAAMATGRIDLISGALAVIAVNLVNLAPAPPLDGSKALGPSLAKIHPMVERAALFVVGGFAVLWALSRQDFMFGAFVGFGLYMALQRKYLRPVVQRLSNAEWLKALGLYAGAVVLCLLAAWLSMRAVGVPADLGRALAMLGLG